MSDIFTIKGVDAVLEINGKKYKFADPLFPEKVKIQRKMKDLEIKKTEGMEWEEYSLQVYELNKKLIKLYIPEITKEDLDSLGEFSFQALLIKVLELTKDQFGAVVEKVDTIEKKLEATQ